MTPRCLGSLTTTMRQHIGMRYNTWPYGVITIPWFLTSRSWKEIIVDFHKTGQYKQSPLSIDKEVVERVTDCTFLGVIVSDDLSWSTNTADVIGKAQQRLYYLTSRHFSEWSEQRERSSEQLFRRWAPPSPLAVYGMWKTSCATNTILHITCSTCCLQVEDTGPYALEQLDWPTASTQRRRTDKTISLHSAHIYRHTLHPTTKITVIGLHHFALCYHCYAVGML